ncbi:MAG: helix-hairpin-helix domain-containing protein [Candidatus Zixiibacteriota bacterium]
MQDRCLLYVFRCAVYFAEITEENRDIEMLKWWNWKNKK